MEQLIIVNDIGAEKALVELKKYVEDKERLIDICNEMINEYKQRIEGLNNDIEERSKFVKHMLHSYMETVEVKETKTQLSYQLPSGKLIYKKGTQTLQKDDSKLVNVIDEQYIKTTKTIDWANYKQRLVIHDDKVIDTHTGEVVDGVTVVEKDGEFQIKY
jgi:hypothetical protein